MFRVRALTVLGVCAVLLGVLVAPVSAAPGGNAAKAAQCAEGGYLDYTRTDDTPFKNEGACTKYAAKGGTLKEIPATLLVTWEGSRATITGSGLKEGTVVQFFYPVPGGGVGGTVPDSTVLANGTVTVTHQTDNCDITTYVATATTRAGGRISTDPSDSPC